MFMYESTLTRRPLYSVSPHFRRMITGSLILNHVAEGELEWFFMFGYMCVCVCLCVCVCVCVGMEALGWDNVSAKRKKSCVGRREGGINVQSLKHRAGIEWYELKGNSG